MTKEINNIFKLNGRVIVITGALGLLGKEHANAVASYGGIPVLLDLPRQGVKDFSAEIKEKYGVDSKGFSVDITDEHQVEKNAKEIIEYYGKIDGLVNNATNNPKVEECTEKNFSRLESFPLEVWNKDISVGLTGSFLCSKYYGYMISKNPEGGSIVNISSDLALIGPDQSLYEKSDLPKEKQFVKPITYSVVKTGLIGLTRYLATYWNDEGVRCNAICPGGVLNNQPEDFLDKVSSKIPMKRLANKNEYQGTLIWMLSEASSYLNGSIVAVDGGRTAQ